MYFSMAQMEYKNDVTRNVMKLRVPGVREFISKGSALLEANGSPAVHTC